MCLPNLCGINWTFIGNRVLWSIHLEYCVDCNWGGFLCVVGVLSTLCTFETSSKTSNEISGGNKSVVDFGYQAHNWFNWSLLVAGQLDDWFEGGHFKWRGFLFSMHLHFKPFETSKDSNWKQKIESHSISISWQENGLFFNRKVNDTKLKSI